MTAIARTHHWPATSSVDDIDIDEALRESFPASDPPSWTPTVTQPPMSGLSGVSRLHTRAPFLKPLLEGLESGALVCLAVLALIALCIPLALVTVSIVNVLSWLIRGIW